jgi:hypothetical protein
MAYKLLSIVKRERVQGSWVFAEGQALNPIPNLVFQNPYEQLRRRRRGIKRKLLNAPRGGELNLYPPLEGLSAAGGLNSLIA